MGRVPLTLVAGASVLVSLSFSTGAAALQRTDSNGHTAPSDSGARSAATSSGAAAHQLALLDFNTALQQDVESTQPGYVAAVDDPATGSVTVYLSGGTSLTAATRALARSFHVALRAHGWPYSIAQLRSSAQAVMQEGKSGHVPGLAATSVTLFDPSFAGITVSDEQPGARSSAARTPGFAAGVPVRFRPEQTAPTASRDNDYSPYNAGDFMFALGADGHSRYCSTGFAVRYKSHNYATTAQHCRENGIAPWTTRPPPSGERRSTAAPVRSA